MLPLPVFWRDVRPSLDRLRAHVEYWSKLKAAIPQYVYHFSHVSNAADILNAGAILSRAECSRIGLRRHDSASPSVILNTPEDKKRFVRLYFRPQTPTQWHCEGI